MPAIQQFLHLLAQAPRRRLLSLGILMLLASLTEGVGILMLIPLLSLMPGATNDYHGPMTDAVAAVFAFIGLPLLIEALLLLFLGLVVLRNLVQFAREWLAADLQHYLVDSLRRRCFDALLHAEWRWISDARQSHHANLLLTDVNRVGVGLHFGLMLLASLTLMTAYIATALILSWPMTLLALLSGGLVFGLLGGQRRHALGLGRDLGTANQGMQQVVQDSLAGMKLTKILGNEQRHLEQFCQVVRRLRDKQMRFLRSNGLARALYQAGGALLLACFLYFGIKLLQMPLVELLILVLLFSRLIPQFANAQQQYHHWLHAMPALEETQRLLTDCEHFAEPNGNVSETAWQIATSIRLEQARVHYAGRKRPALHDVSLEFPARTTTAIMGASGAGKSTLADVLMGLLALDAGQLLVDGHAIDGTDRLAWRRSVAYVPQEVFLFNDSIRNNLLWGKPSATEDELLSALRQAAADFVLQLPQQLDTQVGDGGMRLSGGERQRLALARALLKKPALLILDEATSALDRDNEARVRMAIEQLHGDLTLVIIGHRLATLEHADQVVVLDAGRIQHQGSWAEITRLKGEAT